MGQEIDCRAEWCGQPLTGKALLEGDHVLLRSTTRVKVLLKDATRVASDNGVLRLETPAGTLALHLGPAADKWARKILNPPSLLDKLGVKPDSAIQLVGRFEPDFLTTLPDPPKRGPYDIVFLAAASRADLAGIAKAGTALKPSGGVWVVYPKGVKVITEMDVLNAGREAGLKDNKVAGFSATHTALRFVIPKEKR